MKTVARSLVLFAATTLVAGSAIAAPKLSGEERLAKQLAGRVAGEPVNCIYMPLVRSSEIIDRTAIVYDAGSVIYVNRTEYPRQLDSDDVMVTRLTSSNLCRIDVVQTIDRSSHFMSGSIFLGDFVPYRKPAKAS